MNETLLYGLPLQNAMRSPRAIPLFRVLRYLIDESCPPIPFP